MYTKESLIAGTTILEECLKMDISDMESYVRNAVHRFKDENIDMNKMEDRGELYSLLEHTGTLFLNLSLNYHLYFYGKEEKEKGYKGREIINEIRKEIRENKF